MPDSSGHPAQHQPKLLPVVRRVIQQLDALFIDCAGTTEAPRLADTYRYWLAGGRTGPSGLRHYMQALGAQLSTPEPRATFMQQAERVLIHLQSGYAN